MFVPGVTEPIDYNITEEPPFEYDGKFYNGYEATQRQRQIERYIRQYKRRIIGFESAGIGKEDPIYRRTSRLLAGWNQEYHDFSEAANLTPQTERARVIGFGRGEAARARAAARV